MGAEGGLVSNLDDLLDGGGTLARLLREGEIGDALEKLIQKSGREILDPRPDGCSLMHRFTVLGSYEAVKILREKGARVSVLKSDDSTLLHSAVRTTSDGDTTQDAQRANILELFLSDKRHPIPIDQRNTKGWTALKLASRKGLERCVETLLKHGADPNIPDNENYLPLHNAIGNHPIVKLLVSYPHNINAQTQNGQSPLHIGVESGNVECVLTLLEHEADPNITNKEGITPLFLAARGGNIELVRVLLRHNARVNVTGAAQQIAPLHWAAHKEFTDIALHLIENGADIQLRDKEGRTPLGLASPELASKMIEVAKRRNPNFTAISIQKEPTISAEEKAVRACCEGNVQALQAILQAGININLTKDGTSLLHMGAYCGQLNVTALLLRSGADWQSRDKDGDTVLHFACMKETPQGNHEATLRFLLSTSAYSLINSQNQKGDTPLLVAVRCGFFNRTQILLQHNADSTIRNAKNELTLHRSCCGDTNIGLVFQLAEMLPDMDVQDKDGWTPLMYAARSHSPVIAHYLLQRGADPNLQQVSGFTALHLAAQENQLDICQLLLKYKANPNLTGGPQSLTPLHIASHKSFKDICCLLAEKGADITIQDKDGDTPLSLTHDVVIKQAIQSAHEIYNAQMRERSNSHPTTPPPDGFKCFFRKDSKRDFEEKCALQDIISEKEDSLRQLLIDFKSLSVENEYLHSKLKSYEEDLHYNEMSSSIELSFEEGEEGRGSTSKPWWLVREQELKLSEEQINTTSLDFLRFFDVFKGTYRMTDIVAKKVNRNENWEPSTRKTFLKEVDGLSFLRNPNIVQFIGACVNESSNLYCIIMEYMPGGDLLTLIHVQKRELTTLQRVKMARDIATGMAYLHTFPILHRNLVPSNILIGENLNAKVSDFGFYETKVQTNYYTNAKKHCCIKGGSLRPYYRAPEVIEKHSYSTASDVYSFAMILLELVTMKKPFADLDDCSSGMTWVMRLMMGTRPPIPSDLDPQCQKMIAQCWHQDPAMRPSFKEFLVSCHRKLKQEIQNEEEEKNKTTTESLSTEGET